MRTMDLVRRGLADRLGTWGRLALLLALLAGSARASEYEKVGFERLASFAFVVPGPDAADEASARAASVKQIPTEISGLDGRKAEVRGYMLPVRLVQGRVTEFLLVRDASMCCYGVVPNMNEWVVVRMSGNGVAPLLDVPIAVFGELKVGPAFEHGYMTGIYELAGERVSAAGS